LQGSEGEILKQTAKFNWKNQKKPATGEGRAIRVAAKNAKNNAHARIDSSPPTPD